ncbi:alcohol dehydrogenase catalytic domain-containing protein [Pseudoxanthobacter sp.]|uniref:zinc-dependent alcohol dehydrogenase n=1 Tax=Pseudoxanthobacter sp. TaxID=1925742 RepID=UPI002FE026C9
MQAVRLHGIRALAVDEVPAPARPGPGEVLVRVSAAGICGSDVHNYLTGQWLSGPPRVAGHEFCGVAEATGEGVSHVAAGDLVVADSRFYCGTCEACRAGRHNICSHLGFVGEACDGGFAGHVVLPARLVFAAVPGTDPRIAAMSEPMAVALHAVRRLKAPAGRPVLVAGCGIIGALTALLLTQQHDGPVLVADRNAARAARVAAASGAAVTATDAEALRQIAHAVDATGSTALIGHLVQAMAGGGTLVLVGIAHGRLDIDPNLIVEKEMAVLGSHAFSTADLEDAIPLAARHAGVLAGWIDRVYPLAEAPAAYERMISGTAEGLKAILQPGGATDESP